MLDMTWDEMVPPKVFFFYLKKIVEIEKLFAMIE